MMEPPYYYAMPETSVFMVIVYLLFVAVVTCYMYVMLNMTYIKQNWQKEKCRYGLVIGGEKNVEECSQQLLKQVVDNSTKPFYYTADVMSQFFRELAAQKNVIGNALEYVKSQIVNIVNKILEVISKLFIPIQITLTTLFNIFSKVKAVILSQMYFTLGTMLTMKTAIETMINAIIVVLVALVAVIIVTMLIPFGWGIAVSFLAIFLSISIPLAAFVAIMSGVTKLNIHKMPKKPHMCFDEYTSIHLRSGEIKQISSLIIGDVLKDGSIVTATLTLSAKNTRMYYLNGVFVTGTHLVKHWSTWIPVETHPNSIRIPWYTSPLVYCVNTTSGQLVIGEDVYTDWDEMLTSDFVLCPNNTPVVLRDRMVSIHDCKVGDILLNGNVITGIVNAIEGYHLYVDEL